MQLTQFTDYSLRALIYIALKQEMCTINDIANAYSISSNHLVKIIHHLAKLKIIHTTRGKSGGITLAQPPANINIGEMVLALEPNFDLVPCFNASKANCCIAPVCKLKTILFEAKTQFIDVLKQYTLADIIENAAPLKSILNLNPPD